MVELSEVTTGITSFLPTLLILAGLKYGCEMYVSEGCGRFHS